MTATTVNKTPVHVLTGFLGSGKTTLLNSILRHPSFSNSAVIINEFGEVGLDHHLVETDEDTIIELSNGCLCCTVRGQLIETMERLLEKNPERILIETTGLADPVPVLQALIASPSIADQVTFAGLLTTFDIVSGEQTIKHHKEAAKQVALADIVILTKLDQIPDNAKKPAMTDISLALLEKNPSVEIIRKADFLENLEPHFSGRKDELVLPDIPQNNHHHHDQNRHNENILATVLRKEAPVSKEQMDMFLDLLLSAHSQHVLRIKGLVHLENETKPLVIQGVGNRLSEPYFLEHWPKDGPKTQLVVFLENMSGDFVQRLFSGFFNKPDIDTPDRIALTQNPLSIAGFSSRKTN